MSEQLNIGKLIDATQQRDAIHVAIAPVIAGERLSPGQHVGWSQEGNTELVATGFKGIGIIDPFLSDYVPKGGRCWLFLYPNTVTSLRHEWTHPAFSEVASVDKAASEKWMQDFAAQHYSSQNEYYDGFGRHYTASELVDFAKDFLLHGERHVQQGDESLRDDTNAVEFWRHFEAITGMKVPDYHIDTVPFCCTC